MQSDGARVLLVDDDADYLDLLAEYLSELGLDVDTARSGDEAFAKLVARPPDLVISDIQMPHGNGLDLIRKIRALPPERGGLVPAIAVSGVSTTAATLGAGFQFHFTKPIPTRALVDAIGACVREE